MVPREAFCQGLMMIGVVPAHRGHREVRRFWIRMFVLNVSSGSGCFSHDKRLSTISIKYPPSLTEGKQKQPVFMSETAWFYMTSKGQRLFSRNVFETFRDETFRDETFETDHITISYLLS